MSNGFVSTPLDLLAPFPSPNSGNNRNVLEITVLQLRTYTSGLLYPEALVKAPKDLDEDCPKGSCVAGTYGDGSLRPDMRWRLGSEILRVG